MHTGEVGIEIDVCRAGERSYGLLLLSDKARGEFTSDDKANVRELAGHVGETLDAPRSAST